MRSTSIKLHRNVLVTLIVFGIILLVIPITTVLVRGLTVFQSHASTPTKVVYKLDGSSSLVNQDGTSMTTSSQMVWIGTGKNAASSFAGFIFSGDSIPQGATITTATIDVTSAAMWQWTPLSMDISADASLNPVPFSSAALPSSRQFSPIGVHYADNVSWAASTQHSFDITTLVKSVFADGNGRKRVGIIFQGKGSAYGRKFIAASGAGAPHLTITYTGGVDLTPPPATPTPTTPVPTMMMPSPTTNPGVPTPTSMPGMGSAGGNSAAMGLWVPTKWDTCPQSLHDSYKVIGPDGKWYPTWHPPTTIDPATGKTCTFGHEHGQDPSKSPIWQQVKSHYAYVKPDGTKDMDHAGIPFGYVNEQMDTWTAANGNNIAMRHEDHVGHKVAIATNFPIGLDKGNGTAQFFYPGVTCSYIVKVHQGTYSKDAFENNLHEVLYNVICSDGHEVHIDSMGKFGQAGQFTRSCDSAGDRTSVIKTGFSYSNPNYPGVSDQFGTRGITDRSCVETGFLVPQGQYSQNSYEFWPVVLGLTKKDNTPVVDKLNLLFDVEDGVRYYNPGHTDPTTGVVDNVGHMQDLCYENLNGRTFHGNICDQSTNYGAIKGITWDDPRAGFKDLNRGTYFKPGATHNAGGQQVWYSDPFGNNAQNTPFPGSLMQFVSLDTTDYAAKAGANETANVINMEHDDGGGTVHAPN